MRYQSFTKLAMAALAAAAFVAAPAAVQAKKMKVGFVYVGPIGDHGWTYQHHQGLLAVKKAYGDKVETTHVENVPEGPDAERVTRQLAQQGHDIIFTTSFGFMNPTIKVAKQFPKVKFEHSTGFKRSKNVATYNIRFYEARYVNGVIAGKMTKSNTIGYIASFPIPEVVRASTRPIWVQSRSTRRSSSRSSGSAPGSIRARRPTPPRRWPTRAPT